MPVPTLPRPLSPDRRVQDFAAELHPSQLQQDGDRPCPQVKNGASAFSPRVPPNSGERCHPSPPTLTLSILRLAESLPELEETH